MGSDESRGMIRDLALIGELGAVAGLTDAELLGRFAGRQGGAAEVAFEALVHRHGPMVLGACRRALRDPAEADDAFQATFLVLARKAGSVRVEGSLGPWLRGVARRVAGKALARSRRRRRFEASGLGAGPAAEVDLDAIDLGRILSEELDRLPEKYRSPVVLCHLEGKTHEEAARDLDWPVGTVSGRLSRARDLLRSRLARRGLSPSAPALVAALAAPEAGAVPPALFEATGRLATRFAAGESVPESIHQLARGVLTAMLANQIKLGAIAASAVAALTLGAGYVAGQVGGPAPAPVAPQSKPAKAEAPAAPQAPVPPPPPLPTPSAPTEIPGFPKLYERSRRLLAGGANPKRDVPTISTVETGSLIAMTPPGGRSISAMSLTDGRWLEYQIPAGLRSIPVVSGDLLAMAFSGPDVREVAVFSAQGDGGVNSLQGGWFRQALREPISDEVVPEAGPGVALYRVGNDYYAFSVAAARWDTLHLEAGEEPTHRFGCNPGFATGKSFEPNAIFVQQGRTLHVFSVPLGKWSRGLAVKAPEPPK